MNTNKMRVGFIGCGQIAGDHLRGLQELRTQADAPELQLTVVCDSFPGRAEQWVRERFQAEDEQPAIVGDYRELLQGPHRPDIVSILLPHHLHLEITEIFLRAGIAVQLQKPIGLGIRDSRRIIEIAQETDTALVVSEPSVLGLSNQNQIQWLRSNPEIGQPVFMIDQAVIDLAGGFFMTPWRHMKGYAGAGWFIDHGVHRTHWMLEAFGPCRTAYARTRQLEPVRRSERWGEIAVDTEDLAGAVLEFASGVICQWSVVSGGRGQAHWHVQVWAQRGSMMKSSYTLTGSTAAIDIPFVVAGLPPNPFAHSYVELAHLMKDPSASVISTPERALEAEAIVYACLESAHTGRVIAVQDIVSGHCHAYEDTVWAARDGLAAEKLDRFT